MASRAQIAANRRNAQKSTGPRTGEGKCASRFNALKTGIDAKAEVLPNESAEDLAALIREYYERFHPSAPEERCLVDALVTSDWQIRRLRKAEAELWAYLFGLYQNDRRPEPHPVGNILDSRAEIFARLQRRIDSAERNYVRALKELRRVQAESEAGNAPAHAEPNRPGPVPTPPPTPPGPPREPAQVPQPEQVRAPVQQIGFVPQLRATGPRIAGPCVTGECGKEARPAGHSWKNAACRSL